MKIIKRNGAEVIFDPAKIENAITKANEASEEMAHTVFCAWVLTKTQYLV